jgi:hypothetical protein
MYEDAGVSSGVFHFLLTAPTLTVNGEVGVALASTARVRRATWVFIVASGCP